VDPEPQVGARRIVASAYAAGVIGQAAVGTPSQPESGAGVDVEVVAGVDVEIGSADVEVCGRGVEDVVAFGEGTCACGVGVEPEIGSVNVEVCGRVHRGVEVRRLVGVKINSNLKIDSELER